MLTLVIKKIRREAVWYSRYKWNPGVSTSLSPDIMGVQDALGAAGIPFERINIPKQGFLQFLNTCGYPISYHDGGGVVYVEKCLEHYLSLLLLGIENSDIYIDLASAQSPFPEYVRRTVGCQVFRNDLRYPPGISEGMMIGSDAGHLPVPDQAITKATLHCSFEHFEGDADIDTIGELNRILQRGGKACIIPLYLHTEYVGLTDPFVDRNGLVWDHKMRPIYAKAYGQRHGRFYDVPQLQERIFRKLGELSARLYLVENLDDVGRSLWCHWVLLLEKV